jgi:hypothetical protein
MRGKVEKLFILGIGHFHKCVTFTRLCQHIHLRDTFRSRYGRDFTREDRVEIDHILPMALAKTEKEVIEFNHFSNLQLLTRIDNLRKGASIGQGLFGNQSELPQPYIPQKNSG